MTASVEHVGTGDTRARVTSNRLRRTLVGMRQIGWLRAILSLIALTLALLLARYSWSVPFILDAEHALFDLRQIQAAPAVAQDDRFIMIPYTDETLINTGQRSPLDRTILAKALKRIDAMGPKAIGIDILIDQAQPDDAVLIDAFKSIKTPTFLAHASASTAKNKILFVQQEFLDKFQREIATTNVKPASIELQSDDDDVLRSWANIVAGGYARIPNAMIPEAKAFTSYTGSVAFRRSVRDGPPVFTSIPIDTFGDDVLFESPEAAAQIKKQVQGRYVLIGGNIVDIDLFETPLSRATPDGESRLTWGMEIFAHMMAQMLDNRLLTPLSSTVLWIAAVAAVAGGAFTAVSNVRAIFGALLLVAQLALLIGVPFMLANGNVDTYELSAFGWIVAWFLSFAIVSGAARAMGSEQRKFAQSALGKYLPRDIATEILRDPDALQLHGEKRSIFVVFTDLEGFTKLSHAIEPEMVATLLNRYLESLSDVVLEHGGTIDKFVGDAVVAFWGAPISRADDGERAAKAAIAMHQAGEDFRNSVPHGTPAIGKTRVGLHYGEAIVGNFGGEGRIQYTALGDSMNTASRLESANKQLKSSILFSEAAVERCGLDIFRSMGRIVLRGRSTPISIYEPVPAMADAERKRFNETTRRAIDGDVSAITALLEESDNQPHDAALANLVYRLSHQNEGGYFVLD
ncbi:MAG: CHASE2 domain-containing protein [Sphingomonadaceae bacterium]